jgi:hypothetical protein
MASEPDSRDGVLRGYGEVMAVVQEWELALTLVSHHAERKPNSQPVDDFDTSKSQKEIRRLEDAFLRKTAQAARQSVEPLLEPDTAKDLQGLMTERNRLAHRFLREHAVPGGSDFEPGTHRELLALGDKFDRARASVMRTLAGFEDYTGPVPEHWPAIAGRITERLFNGEAIPRDPTQQ